MGFWNWFDDSNKTKKKGTYLIKVYCLNCKRIGEAHITEEMPVKKFLETEKCWFCKLPLLVQWSTNIERIRVGNDECAIYHDVDIVNSINWENVPDKTKDKVHKDNS